MGKTVERTCERCSKSFLTEPYRVRAGKARFCSKPCADGPKKEAQCFCRVCSVEFWVPVAQVASGRGGQFCSRECAAKGYRFVTGSVPGGALKRQLVIRER